MSRHFVRWTSIRWVQERENEWRVALDEDTATVRLATATGNWYVSLSLKIGDFAVYASNDHPYTTRENAMKAAERYLMNGIPSEKVKA